MRAAVYHGPGDLRFEEVLPPHPGPRDLLLDVATVGICGSDVGEYVHEPIFFPLRDRHPHSGHQGPTIPGHEFSGRVAAVGEEVTGFDLGDLVASGAGVSCGRCKPCQDGNTNMCLNYWTVGLHAHGALAQQVVVPASCCLNLSDIGISADLAALCQPMAIAVHATRRGRLTSDDQVLVLGTGGIGSFITYAASSGGASVTVVDLDQRRLDVAIALGAEHAIHASTVDVASTLGARPTLVFECTATPDLLDLAVRLVADNGRVVVVGHQPSPFPFDFRLVSFGEKELLGTMAHAFAVDFPRAVGLVAARPEVWTRLAPTVYPLEDLVAAGLQPMAEKRQLQIKALFDPSADRSRSLRLRP
jgi:(R,R)-butanediol dehydrogenase/meso-butanediol dehydrogenase/diacetyl reductase